MAEEEQLLMTQADRDRLVTLKKVQDGHIAQRQAAEELKLSERQVRRLMAKIRQQGDRAVIHGLRGKPSNKRLDGEIQKQAIGILKQDVYRGFGPTLAAEFLAKKHQIEVSKETVRKWMRGAGLWRARKQRIQEVHVWRARRERYGELVQWDTSDHDWLEGRGERIYLISMIDDATSRLFARFVRSDCTASNMAVLEEYLKRFGRPLEFYTDKASHFYTTPKKNHAEREQPHQPTQIRRALEELAIGWIGAHSPQAKGRVERSFDTAQDRLVKGLRVAGVNTLEQANAYLEAEYLPEWEAKFTVPPDCSDDAHRSLGHSHDLAAILSMVQQRLITNDYTLRDDNQYWKIAREQARPRLRGQWARVERRRDGQTAVRFEGRYLSVSPCEPPAKKLLRPVAVVQPKPASPKRKSNWMKSFHLHDAPSLKKAIELSNATP